MAVGGRRGGHWGGGTELSLDVRGSAGPGQGGGGGRRCNATAHCAAIAAGAAAFGASLGQPVGGCHGPQYPRSTHEALLVRGQQRGSCRRRSLLRRRRGGVWTHLTAPTHHCTWPVIG